MNPFASIALAAAVIAISIIWRRRRQFQTRSRGRPLPPGPKRLPVFGNLFDIPQHHPWKTYLDWKDTYGDLVYVEALGNTILVLNDIEDVKELLVKRATVYSDRPTLVMLGELMEVNKTAALLQYGPMLRQQRKLCHMVMGPENSKKYISAQEDSIAIFVDNLLHNPKDFYHQLRLSSGRIIMSAIYGIPATTPVEVFLEDADKIMKLSSKATMPGAFIVDLIPMLKYLPSWLPFNNIHKTAKEGRDLFYATVDKPFEYVRQQRKEGIGRPSCATEFMRLYESEAGALDVEANNLIKMTSGSMYGPGSETTHATILVFIHAMALFPDVQKKIQAEIDAVVGLDRLPTILDRPKLHYVNATIKETLRWSPVNPVSVPRRSNVDDCYKGYFIPSGTVIFPNLWAVSRDRKSGIPPEDFSPERFMTGDISTDALDPYSYIFGFGRRECPGQHLADNSLFLIISWMVATVTISRAKDASGVPKQLNPVYTDGMISYPNPFEVDFEPRNADLAAVIKHHIASID